MDSAGEEQDECTYFMDPGCRQTCHGEKWMERFMKHTGYKPDWLHAEVKSLNGIGDGTETLGERELYITLENDKGQHVPGEISSTEIKGSSALLFLSLPSQERLGLVMDFGASEIYSRLLHMTGTTQSTPWTEDASMRSSASWIQNSPRARGADGWQ